jgi:hypothetical protein
MKIPYWIWTGLIILYFLQWSVGLWIEVITNNSKSALFVIVLLSFIIYPIYCFIVLAYIRRNAIRRHLSSRILYIFLLIGFFTNPAVLQVFKQLI